MAVNKTTEKFFNWNSTQRNGILGLSVLIVVLQILYFQLDFSSENAFSEQEMIQFQQKIDSLKSVQLEAKREIQPFNPNFISPYKAYQLQISADEFDRLEAFRKEGKFVNSATEFQQVTKIHDTLLAQISPFFKFPEWVKKKSQIAENQSTKIVEKKKLDINKASENELQKIKGIGEKLSQRIVKYRERLQGFSFKEQLTEIYGIENQVINRIWEEFDILSEAKIVKLNVNTASKYELARLPYINKEQAEKIVLYRSKVLIISSLNELLSVSVFTEDEFKKNELYLSVEN